MRVSKFLLLRKNRCSHQRREALAIRLSSTGSRAREISRETFTSFIREMLKILLGCWRTHARMLARTPTLNRFVTLQNGHPAEGHERAVAMTSLILENADLNRLFPKCRPRGGPPPAPGASTQSSQPHDSPCQTEATAIAATAAATNTTTAAIVASVNTSASVPALPDDMIDLERDTSDRQVEPRFMGGEVGTTPYLSRQSAV